MPNFIFSQNIIDLSKLIDKVNKVNDEFIVKRGNLVDCDYVKMISKNTDISNKFVFKNKDSVEYYVFFDSMPVIGGWLIFDKKNNRLFYFDQQFITVFDYSKKEKLYEKTTNCGLDIFQLSESICGFSNPYYDYENGILYYSVNSLLLPKRKRKLKMGALTSSNYR